MNRANEQNRGAITRLLVGKGKKLLEDRSLGASAFAGDEASNRLLLDLKRFPHAFVMGCIVDRQVKAEVAWKLPYRLSERIGDFKFSTLRNLTLAQLRRAMTRPEPLHRYPDDMSRNLYAAIALIGDEYDGEAQRIWNDTPSSAELVFRLLQFRGVGPKIANMAANILVRRFAVPLSDYYSIDISADVHVRRVFSRLGLVRLNATVEEVIYRARSMHPEFPGLIDLPTWEIGKQWCRPKKTMCVDCYANRVCPSANN